MDTKNSAEGGVGLSEREARILAKANARKARKGNQNAEQEFFQPQSNGFPTSEAGNTIVELKKSKKDFVGTSIDLEHGVTKEKTKKKKRASLTESNSINLDLSQNDLNENNTDPTSFEEKKVKKSKKSKAEPNLDGNVIDEMESQENRDSPPEKKKKKRSKTNLIENGIGEVGTQEDNSSSPPKKKKKKAKKEINLDEAQPSENLNEDAEVTENDKTGTEERVEEPTGAGFTILEEFKANKNQKVFRVLPTWLANPSVISCDLSKNKIPIQELTGLDKFLIEALKRNKVKHFFPVQQQVIPWLLESQQQLFRPCDMCVSAPTGSGKTLAFVLPTIQALTKHSVRRLRCLVVLPVHDLAVQVFRVYSSFTASSHLRVALLSGQTSFYEEQQLLVQKSKTGQYLSKPDIVVCTPGRLVDHIQRTPGFSLKSLRYLIIDEADRIMDEEHNDWLSHVEKAISTTPEHLVAQKLSHPWEKYVQKLLFSATLSQDPEKLTRLGLFQPKLFTSVVSNDSSNSVDTSHQFVGKYTTPAELIEHFFMCPPSLKPLAVYHLLKKFKYGPALCFTMSRESTHRLCELLKKLGDLRVAECSYEVSKGTRDKLLKDFSSGKIDIMVCTDAVSRGMDLGVVDCVISYDAPKFTKNYIHRAGRAARAGRPGTAITLLMESEMKPFMKLLEMAGKTGVAPLDMQVEELEIYEEKFRTALDELKHVVVKEKRTVITNARRKRIGPTGKRKPERPGRPERLGRLERQGRSSRSRRSVHPLKGANAEVLAPRMVFGKKLS